MRISLLLYLEAAKYRLSSLEDGRSDASALSSHFSNALTTDILAFYEEPDEHFNTKAMIESFLAIDTSQYPLFVAEEGDQIKILWPPYQTARLRFSLRKATMGGSFRILSFKR